MTKRSLASAPADLIEPKTLTRAEREARKAFAAQEAEKALSDYEKAQRVFHANREGLKAERLAREAAASKTSSSRLRVRTPRIARRRHATPLPA